MSTCSDFLRVLHHPGAWYEIRAIKAKERPGGSYTKTASGYFDSPDEAGAAAELLDAKHSPAGTYVTINPVNQACAARAYRQIKFGSADATEGADILCRRWIVLDIDSERPKGVSATKEEATAATAFAQRIETELHGEGWPLPVRCMTGNGAMLLYRVDLPNDKPSEQLVRDVLKALSVRFTDGGAHVDTGLYDANRIIKVMGTHGRKGDSTPDRPHRKSAFKAPAEISVVPYDLLLAVAESVRKEERPAPTKSGLVVRDSGGQTFEKIESTASSVRGYLERHGVTVKREREKGGTVILDLESCPLTGANGGSSVSVLIGADGTISYPNRHNRGVGLTWHDLREHFEPGFKAWVASLDSPTAQVQASPIVQPVQTVQAGGLKTISVEELLDMDIKPVRWIVPGIIPEGLTILVGNPKIGKSTFLLSAVLDLAGGHPVFGEIDAEPCQTLYLSLEDNARRIRDRVLKMNRGRSRPSGLVFVTGDSGIGRLGLGAETEIEKYLDAHPDIKLVVIDTWVKIKPWKTAKSNATEYDADSAAWGILHEISTRRRVAIVVVHHTRKTVVPGGDWITEISGSQGIAGIVDTILLIRRGRGEHQALLHVAGREHDDEREVRFVGHSETKTWTLQHGQSEDFTTGASTGASFAKEGTRRRDIIEYLTCFGPSWPKYVAEGIGLDSSENIRKDLFRMWQRGVICKDDRDRFFISESQGPGGPGGPVGPGGPGGYGVAPEAPVAPVLPLGAISTTERENRGTEGGEPFSPPGTPPFQSSTSVPDHTSVSEPGAIPPPPPPLPMHLHGYTPTLAAYNTSSDNLRKEHIALTSGRVTGPDYDRRARRYVLAVEQASEFRKAVVKK